MRTTDVKYRDWPLWARVVEKLYRWTHSGQIRTLVLTDDQVAARRFGKRDHPSCS